MLKPLAAALLVAGPAFGSSDDAWSAFAAEVRDACLAAVGDRLAGASALVDPFGSESYGMAVVTGRTADDQAASMICVMDKETRAVQIGGELNMTVTLRGLQPLSAADIEDAGLAGELSCSFETSAGTLLLASGNVASDSPAEAVVKPLDQPMILGAQGGFDAIIEGASFTGTGGTATIEVTGDAVGGGESPAHPAVLTVRAEGGDDLTADGLWGCGP